jgi:hypothetical protein
MSSCSQILQHCYVRSLNLHKASHPKQGRADIDTVVKHLKLICGTDERTETLKKWIAHQVQYPGVMVGWAPIIQGISGCGKSFIGELVNIFKRSEHYPITPLPRTNRYDVLIVCEDYIINCVTGTI